VIAQTRLIVEEGNFLKKIVSRERDNLLDNLKIEHEFRKKTMRITLDKKQCIDTRYKLHTQL